MQGVGANICAFVGKSKGHPTNRDLKKIGIATAAFAIFSVLAPADGHREA
jgi:hypothetical protein